ncbi:MAG: 50S ribosomal protein L23 [Candidatus Diapherotrites archaeon]
MADKKSQKEKQKAEKKKAPKKEARALIPLPKKSAPKPAHAAHTKAVAKNGVVQKMDAQGAELQMHAREVLVHPLVSEKAVNMIEGQNKLSFIVAKNASKFDVKKAVEDAYKVKVENVQTLNDSKGRKKAIVRLAKEFKARDVATKMGIV